MNKSVITSLILAASFVSGASAQFVGNYAPSNWTLQQSLLPPANGFVATHTASTLILVGSNDGSGQFGFTGLDITVAQDGFISFNWAYDSSDSRTQDSAAYNTVINFAYQSVFLTSTPGQSGGIVNLPVFAGDLFGFIVFTDDNLMGPGQLTITNFVFVPAPGAAGLVVAGGLAATRRRRLRH